MQGRTYAPGGVKDELADAIREFNQFVVKDERVEVVAMPFRDGVSIIQRKWGSAPAHQPVIMALLQLCLCVQHLLKPSPLSIHEAVQDW